MNGNGIEGRQEVLQPRSEFQPLDRVNHLPDEVYEEIRRRFYGREIPHSEIERVWVFPDQEHKYLQAAAAQQKIEVFRINSYGFHINPTGLSFEEIHRITVEESEKQGVDFSNTFASHLDGYHPYPRTGKDSFGRYTMQKVIIPLKIPDRHYRLIDEEATDPVEEARLHNKWIKRFSQAMAQYGIGPDGHLAFIRPGTPFDVETHYVELSPETIYRDHVERRQDTPDHAITIGPKNIIDGGVGHIQVVLFGAKKGERLNEALTGPITPNHTASVLRLPEVRRAVTIFCDEEAASQFTW